MAHFLQMAWQWGVPLVFGIVLHEVAHGFMAHRLGDDTARRAGRLTLNPVKHIDPVGTVALPALLIALKAPFVFGWAKPVPVRFGRLRPARRGMILVALAGPISNFLQAFFWAMVLKLALPQAAVGHSVASAIMQMAQIGVGINLMLMVFNLIPVPPLDGGRVLQALAPLQWTQALGQLERVGIVVVVVLLASGVLSQVISPVMRWMTGLVLQTVGILP